MNAQRQTCGKCGAELGPDVSEGVCPACALRGALLPAANEAAVAEPGLPAQTTVHYFGDYELLAEIGRGGMGVVYRARQTKLNRPVALKMILAGRLASEADVKRFQQEAQAAANLQHPNIVPVHEVGEHDGQHYYSMDLVEGRSLAELARPGPMPARQAALYMKIVADAVHYAHQHGTFHRDLKPTNILVDGRDEPRVTDFGLARCEQFDSRLTTTGQLIGTPAFMPPEQAQAKNEAVGAASDVYSIGAVLYYLLTQRPPFVDESLPALLDHVVRDEPVSPRVLNPGVPRDLQTICLKCLQKDPVHRFRSAQELSDELGRFCKGEPILSRPPAVAERAWRWCARNRVIAGSVATVVLVLAAGTAVSTWEAVRARAEAAKSRQIAQFLQDMLDGVGPSVASGRDTKLMREILDKTSARITKELTTQPSIKAALLNTLGEVYDELGELAKAEAMFRETVGLRRRYSGRDDAEMAKSLNNLGVVLWEGAKFAEAEAAHREALAIRKRRFDDGSLPVANSLQGLATVFSSQGKLPEAEAMYRQVLAIRTKLLSSESPEVAAATANLGTVLWNEGKFEASEALNRQALALYQKAHPGDNLEVAQSLHNLACALQSRGHFAEAEQRGREALAMRKRLLGANHPDVAVTLSTLGSVLQNEGNLPEAEAAEREAVAIGERTSGDRSVNVALMQNNLSDLLRLENKLDEAEALQRKAIATLKVLLGGGNQYVGVALDTLGNILRQRRQLPQAEATHREALALRRKALGDENPDVAQSLHDLANVLRDEGRLDEAETLYRQALDLRIRLLGESNPDAAETQRALAELLRERGTK